MSAFSFRKHLDGEETKTVARLVRRSLASAESTLSQQPSTMPSLNRDGTRPKGLTEGSVINRPLGNGGIEIGSVGKNGETSTLQFDPGTALYIGQQTGTGAPTTAQFPINGNYGFYDDGSTHYFVINTGGTVHGITISTLPGTITDAQHGSKTTGTLHAAVTTTVNGFMLATDKVILDAATASPDGSTSTLLLCGTDGSLQARTAIRVHNGVTFQTVVQQRQTGWTAPTGTASRATFDTASVTLEQLARRVYALLLDLGNSAGHGLISSV